MNTQEIMEKLDRLYKIKMEPDYADYVPLLEVMQIVQEKVKIPEYVANYLEYCKKRKRTLKHSIVQSSFETVCTSEREVFRFSGAGKWLCNDTNVSLFVQAWVEGYTTGEPLYTVRIPNPHNTGNNVLCLRKDKGKVQIAKQKWNVYKHSSCCQLTEQEIKKDFAWAWDAGFATLVED